MNVSDIIIENVRFLAMIILFKKKNMVATLSLYTDMCVWAVTLRRDVSVKNGNQLYSQLTGINFACVNDM